MKIVVTPPFTEEQKKHIIEAAGLERPIFRLKSEITAELLPDPEVILVNLDNPTTVR